MLHAPTAIPKLGGQPIEQLRVRRRGALCTEIVLRLDDAETEKLLPVAIDRHARRERIAAIDEPTRQIEARGAITGITLIAGFASTVGWPASALFLHEFGWRAACLIWAGLNLLLAAPVNWLVIPRRALPTAPPPRAAPELPQAEAPRGAMPILAFFFSATWFVQGAMAAHLPGLLRAAGASSTAAIAAAALVGPAQVAARIVEFGLLRKFHPVSSARLAAVLHPVGAALLAVFGAPAMIAFALLHGAGNGMITIAKGTLPLALFGPGGYGLRSGVLSAPARLTQSAAPFLFGLLLNRFGVAAVWCSAGLCLAAFASLFALRPRTAAVATAG